MPVPSERSPKCKTLRIANSNACRRSLREFETLQTTTVWKGLNETFARSWLAPVDLSICGPFHACLDSAHQRSSEGVQYFRFSWLNACNVLSLSLNSFGQFFPAHILLTFICFQNTPYAHPNLFYFSYLFCVVLFILLADVLCVSTYKKYEELHCSRPKTHLVQLLAFHRERPDVTWKHIRQQDTVCFCHLLEPGTRDSLLIKPGSCA